MALIIGAGTAIAIGGALFGTLLPSILGIGKNATIAQVPGVLFGLFGTVSTLIYFTYTVRKGEGERF